MVDKLAMALTQCIIIEKGNEKNRAIYEYGLQILLNTVLSLVIVICLGIIFNKIPETIFYLFCYCSIRLYAGGFHASTNNRCMIMFVIAYCISIVLFEIYPNISQIWLILTLGIENILVLVLSPIEAVNNPLPELKKANMKFKASLLSMGVSCLIVIIYWNAPQISILGYFGFTWLVILLICGEISIFINKRGEKNEKDQNYVA